jgi:alpha-ribazole phosphatase
VNLYLVRHLAPQVGPGVCYGQTDLPVDPALQAAALPALRAQLPDGAAIYSSPLQRCAQLAAALGGSAVRIDPRLAELDFGSWEMRHWDDIARTEIDAWACDVAMARPGGAESVYDMALRIDAFFTDLIKAPEASVIVICHAGTIRLLTARLRGLSPVDMARAAAERAHHIAYGAIISLNVV